MAGEDRERGRARLRVFIAQRGSYKVTRRDGQLRAEAKRRMCTGLRLPAAIVDLGALNAYGQDAPDLLAC